MIHFNPFGPPRLSDGLTHTKTNQVAGAIIDKTLAMAEPMLKPFRRVTVAQASPTDATRAYVTNVGDTVTSEMPVPVLIGYSSNLVGNTGAPQIGDQAIVIDMPDQGAALLASLVIAPVAAAPPPTISPYNTTSGSLPPASIITGTDASGKFSWGTGNVPGTGSRAFVTVTLGTPVPSAAFSVSLIPTNLLTTQVNLMASAFIVPTLSGQNVTAWTLWSSANLQASQANTTYSIYYTVSH